MAAKLTINSDATAESCTVRSSRSRRPVRKLLEHLRIYRLHGEEYYTTFLLNLVQA